MLKNTIPGAIVTYLIFGLQHAIALSPLCPLPPYDDDVHLNCITEFGSYAPPNPKASNSLTFLEYNIDRNGLGGDGSNEQGLGAIVNLLQNRSVIPDFDVLVLSEVARGCQSWGGINFSGADYLAKQLLMNYYYAVEYVTVSQSTDINECSIGNALLSKFPIKNIQQLRYKNQCCRYPDRYGGRIDLIGDIYVSNKVAAHVHSCHLESGTFNPQDIINSIVIREEQADESANVTWSDNAPRLIIGDLNSPGSNTDPTILKLEQDGFTNSMENYTVVGGGLELIQYDYLFSSPSVLFNAGYCSDPACDGVSDHVPYFATMSLV